MPGKIASAFSPLNGSLPRRASTSRAWRLPFLVGKRRPSASARQFIEFAVNMPEHEPQVGQAAFSMAATSTGAPDADRGQPVAAAGEGRSPGTLQMQIPQPPVGARQLTEQQRPAVAQLRDEAAELMPGVGLRDRGEIGRAHV